MMRSRLALWLLVFLLLIGQQGSLLHHLGHELDEVAQQIAQTEPASDSRHVPEAEDHAGSCALCVGFTATVASLPSGVPPGALGPSGGFARPLALVLLPVSTEPVTTPIRGPPPDFSIAV